MKKSIIYLSIIAVVAIMTSCGSTQSLTKDVKYMGIKFKPLAKTDFTLVGNFQSESTISGKMGPTGKVLDAQYQNHYKKGLITKTEATQMMYFAPQNDNTITGALYDDQIFNSVYTPADAGKKGGFFSNLFHKIKVVKPDPAIDFAYYDMASKYPDVDYFINVRFDRKIVYKGKKFTETITVKADGVKLRTDS